MRTGRKYTGGKYVVRRKKRKHELPGQRRIVKLGEDKRKTIKIRGGNIKTFIIKGKTINLKKGNQTKKSEIKKILETPSNRFLARQDIITKGTIVETEFGKAKITNRPSQEGVINGILIE